MATSALRLALVALVLSLAVTGRVWGADSPETTPGSVPRSIVLPEYCNTPDAMALMSDGNLIVSVPNFTDPSHQGVLMQVTPQDEVSLFCRLPLHPRTGRIYPMGVRQAPSGDLYVADCQFMEGPGLSRLLCVRVVAGQAGEVEVVAEGLEVANGVAIHGDYVYVTDSAIGTNEEGAVISAVYRFRLDQRGVRVRTGDDDPHLVATFLTLCQEIPVGADGIDFDEQGNLYVSNCGDAVLEKLVLNRAGQVVRREVLTPPGAMKSADGIFYDHATGRIYVADILANAILAVTLDGQVELIAQDGDNDGSRGQLDGPSEAVVRGDELVVANFDRVFPGSVNTQSDLPATLAVISKHPREQRAK